MEAMFGSQNTYGFGNAMGNTVSPFNAFFPSNSDPFWGSNSAKANQRSAGLNPYRMHETPDNAYNYHHSDSYQMTDGLKHVDSSLAGKQTNVKTRDKYLIISEKGLTLDHIKASDQFSNKTISGNCLQLPVTPSHTFGPFLGPFSGSEPKKFDSMGSSGAVGQVPKKTTWASIASQPAKPQPKSLKSKMSSSVLTGSTSKHLPPTSMETIGTWEVKNGSAVKTPPVAPPTQAPPPAPQQTQQRSNCSSIPLIGGSSGGQWAPPARQMAPQQRQLAQQSSGSGAGAEPCVALPAHPVLDKLRVENNYNPKEFDLNPKNARFFIIKSYSEDDIHRSIKYSIWCSTEHGNKRLDQAFKHQQERGPIYLLYSVNGSGESRAICLDLC